MTEKDAIKYKGVAVSVQLGQNVPTMFIFLLSFE